MQEKIITFDSEIALNAYLAEKTFNELKESDRKFWETVERINIDNANSARRECEESHRRSNGKVVISSEWDENRNLHYNYLQTTSLTEFKNYMLVNKEYVFQNHRSYFAIWSSYEISCGYPTNDMIHRYANEERMHGIPISVIPCYGTRIVEFGNNLRFLTREQVAALTYPQRQAIYIAIQNGEIDERLLKGTPLGDILKQYKKGKVEFSNPPMEMEGGCCILI